MKGTDKARGPGFVLIVSPINQVNQSRARPIQGKSEQKEQDVKRCKTRKSRATIVCGLGFSLGLWGAKKSRRPGPSAILQIEEICQSF